MARHGFKRWWTRIIPEPMERSTFVLAANLTLAASMVLWEPIPWAVWSVEQPLVRWTLLAACFAGWGTVVASSFLIDHFDLFGLRQVYCHFRERTCTPVPFKVHSLYRFVRHPMMLGFLVALWSTPVMTVGHLVLAVELSTFIFVGLRYEERDLARTFGRAYEEYRQQTSMVLPLRRGRPSDSAATTGAPRTEESYGCVNEPC
jgi:protein-S-isoprenylcysteine O-methyltransferase Ste14